MCALNKWNGVCFVGRLRGILCFLNFLFCSNEFVCLMFQQIHSFSPLAAYLAEIILVIAWLVMVDLKMLWLATKSSPSSEFSEFSEANRFVYLSNIYPFRYFLICVHMLYRCKKWIQYCRRDFKHLTPADLHQKNYLLCSDHFEPNQFNVPEERKSLVWDAVPTLF